ncbi:hypothetical protein PR048_021495 [Dryococelus australis]|uniref:Sushi domain-containing protein n=1 Tax=Dryococelus australis TaxID=614101 RepID=A0ABQ9GYJ5_9NEOP|nr:hypothetical protein PR048_021495 [Dryococelus australis]
MRQILLLTGFLGCLQFLLPLHSGAAPYLHRFALIGFQDLDVERLQNLSTPRCAGMILCPQPYTRSIRNKYGLVSVFPEVYLAVDERNSSEAVTLEGAGMLITSDTKIQFSCADKADGVHVDSSSCRIYYNAGSPQPHVPGRTASCIPRRRTESYNIYGGNLFLHVDYRANSVRLRHMQHVAHAVKRKLNHLEQLMKATPLSTNSYDSLLPPRHSGAERLTCSPSTKTIRVRSPAGSLRIFACGNRVFSGISRFPLPFIPCGHRSGVCECGVVAVYRCWRGRRETHTCAAGQVFSAQKLRCEEATNDTAAASCRPPLLESPPHACADVIGGGLYPDTTAACRHYYRQATTPIRCSRLSDHFRSEPRKTFTDAASMPSISRNTCINQPLHGHPDRLMNPWKVPDCSATRHSTFTEDAYIVH